MATYSEDWQRLPEQAKDLERARQSLIEEFDAIDLYEQRIQSSGDEELKTILVHNRDEEKEHAALLFAYIKSHDPVQAEALSKSDFPGAHA